MEKYDIYLSKQNNENIDKNIDNISLIPNFEKQKYILPNEYNYSINNKNNPSTKTQIRQIKERYPYYFQYGNDALNLNDFSSYKQQNYNLEYQIDKLNTNNHSDIVYRNVNSSLNWYENFKKSKFYNRWNINKVDLGQENKENNNNNYYNNNQFCYEEEINNIANSIKTLNNTRNNSQFKSYLIKNKYAELF